MFEKPELQQSNKVEKVTVEDLQPEKFRIGEVEIILQRNAKDNRDPNSPLEMGALVPEAAEKVHIRAQEFFDKTFAELGEEAKTVDILIVAADTKLDTPVVGIKSEHKRAVETANEVISAVKKSMEKFSLSPEQLLNKTEKPIELSSGRLRDLRIFEDSPDFVQFLKDKYGPEKGFWVAFEVDKEKDKRLEMGAEGPEDIADRVDAYLKVVSRAMRSYVELHPGRRVIVWAVSHYDTVSPFVKKYVSGLDKTAFHDEYLPIDQGAGVVMVVGEDGVARTKIQGKEINVSLWV